MDDSDSKSPALRDLLCCRSLLHSFSADFLALSDGLLAKLWFGWLELIGEPDL